MFKRILEKIGIDPSYLEFVNIREHSSFVHRNDRIGAQKVAEDAIKSAAARLIGVQKVEILEVGIEKKTLVIGGGVAGLSAALDLAEIGYEVYLVEQKPSIGGKMSQLDRTFPTDDCSI